MNVYLIYANQKQTWKSDFVFLVGEISKCKKN